MTTMNKEKYEEDSELNERSPLLSWLWQKGVNSVKGRSSVNVFLEGYPIKEGDYTVISVGKAASDMMLGALDTLGNQLKSGLVLTKHDHIDPDLLLFGQVTCHESSHPVPDESCLTAGRLLIDKLSKIPYEHHVVVLISGGASSLVEVLCDECNLQDLRKLNQWGLNNGLDINEMNYMRQRVSRIKGGKLQDYIDSKNVLCLYISDVPEDNINVIGSGLLFKNEELGDSIELSTKQKIDDFLSGLINLDRNSKETPRKFRKPMIEHHVVANNNIAKNSIYKYLSAFNKPVFMSEDSINTDYEVVAETIFQTLKNSEEGTYIWGGEPTVVLPESPGLGGRNQALALLLSIKIKDLEGISILVAGTDGTDGPTNAAGAFVSSDTYQLAIDQQLDPEKAIEEANAYELFASLDALFIPGPTGTNVMDLVIAIKST